VVLQEEDVVDVEEAWGFCLVGYFVRRFPGRAALNRLCDSWNAKCQSLAYSSGWFVFLFEDATSRDEVMLKGPYFAFGYPLSLKKMTHDFDYGKIKQQ